MVTEKFEKSASFC